MSGYLGVRVIVAKVSRVRDHRTTGILIDLLRGLAELLVISRRTEGNKVRHDIRDETKGILRAVRALKTRYTSEKRGSSSTEV